VALCLRAWPHAALPGSPAWFRVVSCGLVWLKPSCACGVHAWLHANSSAPQVGARIDGGGGGGGGGGAGPSTGDVGAAHEYELVFEDAIDFVSSAVQAGHMPAEILDGVIAAPQRQERVDTKQVYWGRAGSGVPSAFLR
jgi:hypothetical protein